MFASRLCRVPLTAFVTTLGKQPALIKPTKPCTYNQLQCYANDVKTVFGRRAKRMSLKEKLAEPSTGSAFNIGRGVVAGASVVGIGALCFYGLGLSNQPGALENSLVWPAVVRHRIRDTYMYFGGSLLITAAAAIAASRNPTVLRMMTRNSLLSLGATFAAMIGTGMYCRSIPYSPGFGKKQLAWILHSSVLGAVVAPMMLMGGPVLVKALWYTAGVVAGLSAIAVCAPSEKFLNMGGPLAVGLGLVFAASVGTFFLPPTTALGAGLYSVAIYGGLVLFSFFLLYDTQKIIRSAESYPVYAERPFDPINSSIGIYVDTLNIFIRLVAIFSGGGGRRK